MIAQDGNDAVKKTLEGKKKIEREKIQERVKNNDNSATQKPKK